ncbi:MAG: OmpA family protein [Acidimicrobiales bacterium]
MQEDFGRRDDVQPVLRRWWWVPVLVLGVLLLTAWFLAGMVQADARALAAEAAGIDEDRVEMVDGLNVYLTGFADEASRDEAVAAVDALDSSWEVVGFVGDEAAPGALQSAGTAAATTESSPEADNDSAGNAGTGADEAPSASMAAVELDIAPNGEVVISGTVADEARRVVIVAELIERAGAENVTDDLVVDPAAVIAAGGSLTARGVANNDAQADAWVEGSTAAAQSAGLDFIDEVTVAAADDSATDDAVEGADGTRVEDELNALFELDPIEFDYNEATIRPGSNTTLDAAASVITSNPDVGAFRVVGHTDSDGDAADNLRLSQARADAVVTYLVDLGVDPARLQGEGRGETELKVEPEQTIDDKQRNRRIEWELVE